MINTIIIIGGFFLILMVIDLIKLFRLNPNELWHPQQTKIARHGKFFTFAGLLGVAVLAYAYYLTITVKPRMSALTTFMTAVFLVVIGTYLIFIAGSIIVLKLLQKTKDITIALATLSRFPECYNGWNKMALVLQRFVYSVALSL